MTALDDLHAAQHDDLVYPSDQQLWAFLAEMPADRARLDLIPVSEIELRHLNRASAARRTA